MIKLFPQQDLLSREDSQLTLVGEMGYKTSGFPQGEMLSKSLTVRAGLAVVFNEKNKKSELFLPPLRLIP